MPVGDKNDLLFERVAADLFTTLEPELQTKFSVTLERDTQADQPDGPDKAYLWGESPYRLDLDNNGVPESNSPMQQWAYPYKLLQWYSEGERQDTPANPDAELMWRAAECQRWVEAAPCRNTPGALDTQTIDVQIDVHDEPPTLLMTFLVLVQHHRTNPYVT